MTVAAGTRLGRYEIRSQIGAGGMGEGQRATVEKPPDWSWTRDEVANEGPSLFKCGGKYYLTGAAFYKGLGSSVAAISDNVYGPNRQGYEAAP